MAQYDNTIDKIEDAVFGDPDEPGCRDSESGMMGFTEIGRIRIRKILRELAEKARASRRMKEK